MSVVDCGSKFTVWKRLHAESAPAVRDALEEVFASFGPPKQLLSDNGTVFRSREVMGLLGEWQVE